MKARILDVQHDRAGRVEALEKALSFTPEDDVLRHQFGVALSKVGLEQEAIEQFTKIIDAALGKGPPGETLVMALTTRIINLKRLGQLEQARSDLMRARDLIQRYPHLGAAATRLSDLEAEFPPS